MRSGIYAIKNTKNGKVYVGSSTDLDMRWKQHRTELCSGNHRNKRLLADWNLYGEDAFEVDVLQPTGDGQDLLALELEWMKIFKSLDPKTGYNINQPVATPGSSRKVRVEFKVNREVGRYLRCKAAEEDISLGELIEKMTIAAFAGHTITASL